jgi:hypothetical protein
MKLERISMNKSNFEYLVKRGISLETIKEFKLREEKNSIKIPYYDQNGKFLYYKCRSKVSKEFWYQPKGISLKLYNQWNLDKFKDYVVICEGEIDCLTLIQFGFNAVGCPGANLFKREWAKLFDYIEKVIIGFDNDISGIEGAKKLAEEYFNYRDTFNILIPRANGVKDINDLLTKSNYKREDYSKLINEAMKYEAEKSISINSKRKSNKNNLKVTRFETEDAIGEIVYSKKDMEGGFLVYSKKTGKITEENEFSENGKIYIPDIESELIYRNVIRIPEGISDYGSTENLLNELHLYLNKYVDIESELDRDIALTYVLLSWGYNRFSSISYLRILGDYGSGKSRLLQVLNICYKSIRASGNASEAPIFRLIDKYGGTLIIDEAEFGRNSEKSEGIKDILRFGKDRDGVVLRCNSKNNEVETFKAFGPKILGSRRSYSDDALESRIIDIKMKETKAEHIPLNLDVEEFEYDSGEIRRKLLKWSLENYFKINTNIYKKYIDNKISKRINEMNSPLICIRAEDENFIEELMVKAKEKHQCMLEDKSLRLEAEIVKEIFRLYSEKQEDPLLKKVAENLSEDKKRNYSPRFIGSIIRDNLQFITKHTREGNIIVVNKKRLTELIEEYNLKDLLKIRDEVTDVTEIVKDKSMF